MEKELANIIKCVAAPRIVCIAGDMKKGGRKMKDPRVQIKKRYKNTLSKRFDIKGAKLDEMGGWYEIEVPCNLCGVYYLDNCGNCPFRKFEIVGYVGCMAWVQKIGATTGHRRFTFGPDKIRFRAHKYNIVKKQLERLRKKASEYIEWV